MDKLFAKGDPDDFVLIRGNETLGYCHWNCDGAFPFIIANRKLYIGQESDGHWSIGNQLIGKGDDEIHNSDKYGDGLENARDEALRKLYRAPDSAAGRIWREPKSMYGQPNSEQIKTPVISFWCDENGLKKVDLSVMDELLGKLGIGKDNVLVVTFDDNGHGEVSEYGNWNPEIKQMGEKQKEIYALHLMNAKNKHNATSDFRATRDRKIGQKLTNDKGVEMPMAQYRSMLYQENKKKIKITESQYKRLFLN